MPCRGENHGHWQSLKGNTARRFAAHCLSSARRSGAFRRHAVWPAGCDARKTEASLLSHAADLDQLLSDLYPDERLADDFHQRYVDARDALGQKAHSGS